MTPGSGLNTAQVIGYGYSNNRIVSISVNGTALLGSITYDPFGPAVAWLWPSATTPALKIYRDYDLDGRMTRWELKNGVSYIQRDVVWDNASRVTNLKDLLTTTQANNQSFGYDAIDRLTTTQLGTATTAAQGLAYDAIGNRTSATLRPKSGSTTTPIAIDVFYVHADHLNTPRVITRPTDNKVVWKWDSTEAFGNNAPNENPSALGAFSYNLRMPAQYFDQETGTFYNYFRDYDPSLGRYVQSDPIGLGGGINTFGYVSGSPLSFIDVFGLVGYAPARPLPPNPLRGGFECEPSGGGGVTIFLPLGLSPLQLKCTGNCIRLHEELHIEELRKRDRQMCKGKRNFERPTYDTRGLTKDAELRAYDLELNCLQTKLNGMGACDECKKPIDDRIQEISPIRRQYE